MKKSILILMCTSTIYIQNANSHGGSEKTSPEEEAFTSTLKVTSYGLAFTLSPIQLTARLKRKDMKALQEARPYALDYHINFEMNDDYIFPVQLENAIEILKTDEVLANKSDEELAKIIIEITKDEDLDNSKN